MKDNNTVQRDERTLEHGLEKVKITHIPDNDDSLLLFHNITHNQLKSNEEDEAINRACVLIAFLIVGSNKDHT